MQNVANHNVTRKIQYRHGMMRREDSLGVVTTPSIADIANCETRGLRLPQSDRVERPLVRHVVQASSSFPKTNS